jgi:uncharacterized protein (DUF58 family)
VGASLALLLLAVVTLSPALALVGAALALFYLAQKWTFEARLRKADLRVRRRLLSPVHHEDRPIDVEMTLEGDPRGLDVALEDVAPAGLRLEGGVPPGGGLLAYRATRHGSHRFERARLRLRDPGGLFEETRLVDAPATVQVLVGLDRLREARAAARRRQIQASRADPLGRLFREFEFEGLRAYAGGDRLRDIDWKRTARFERMMTKTYEKELESTLLVLLDAGRTMRARRGGPGKLARAMELTLELAEMATAQGYRIGVLVVDESRVLEETPASPSVAGARRLAERLSRLPPVESVARRLDVGDFDATAARDPFFDRMRSLHPRVHAGSRSLRAVADGIAARHKPGSLLVLALTDLETDPRAMTDALLALRRSRHAVVCGVLGGARYLRPAGEPRVREVEQAYRERAALARAQAALRARRVSVVEMAPQASVLELLEGA